jgi:DNA-binding YbaB/EbfC family protein
MTDNPFESLGDSLGDSLGGAGGFDLQGLLQQAQQMQEQLESAQQQLADARVDGSAGGGAVTVTVNGIGELQTVTIRPGTFDGSSDDDLGDLGDLVVAAYRDAKAQADALAGSALGPVTGGLPGSGGPAGGQLGFSPGQE